MATTVITDAGVKLMTNLLSNKETCTFKELQLSSHTYSDDEIRTLTNTVDDVKQTVTFTGSTVTADKDAIKLTAVAENREITETFAVNTMAIIVTGTVSGNIVYAAVNNSDAADIQPKYDGHSINRITYQFTVQVGAADNVTVTVVPEILAESVSYDDADTSLDAANVQAAIEKLKQNADDTVAGDIGVTDTDSYFGSEYSDLQTVIAAIIAKLKALESADTQTATDIAALKKADETINAAIANLPEETTINTRILKSKQAIETEIASLADSIFTPLHTQGDTKAVSAGYGSIRMKVSGTMSSVDDPEVFETRPVILNTSVTPDVNGTVTKNQLAGKATITEHTLQNSMNYPHNSIRVREHYPKMSHASDIMECMRDGISIEDTLGFGLGSWISNKVSSSDGDWTIVALLAGINESSDYPRHPHSVHTELTFLIYNNYKDSLGPMFGVNVLNSTDEDHWAHIDENSISSLNYNTLNFYNTAYYYQLQHYIAPNTKKLFDSFFGANNYQFTTNMQVGDSLVGFCYPYDTEGTAFQKQSNPDLRVRPLFLEDIIGPQMTANIMVQSIKDSTDGVLTAPNTQSMPIAQYSIPLVGWHMMPLPIFRGGKSADIISTALATAGVSANTLIGGDTSLHSLDMMMWWTGNMYPSNADNTGCRDFYSVLAGGSGIVSFKHAKFTFPVGANSVRVSNQALDESESVKEYARYVGVATITLPEYE